MIYDGAGLGTGLRLAARQETFSRMRDLDVVSLFSDTMGLVLARQDGARVAKGAVRVRTSEQSLKCSGFRDKALN